MNHAIFVLPSYALGVLMPAGFAIQAALRLRRARRVLAALEPQRREGLGRERRST